MKQTLTFLIIFLSFNTYSQIDTIRLSQFKLCVLTIDELKDNDADLKQVRVEEMNLCDNDFLQDMRFENWIGYESKLYPGVIFQKYSDLESNAVAKIHLTKDFKGYLPDGNYIDMSKLKAVDILNKYDSLDSWTSSNCSDYYEINDRKQNHYYVKINKDKQPQFPVDEKYYSGQPVEGIDIIAECAAYYKADSEKPSPLILVDGKEATKEEIEAINPDDVDSISVWKEPSALVKYGEKGKNGVVEIFMKKKK